MNTIYPHTQPPEPSPDDKHYSVDVITCDEDGLLNIGFYSFIACRWMFHTETLCDYYEAGAEMNFVWMYKPAELTMQPKHEV